MIIKVLWLVIFISSQYLILIGFTDRRWTAETLFLNNFYQILPQEERGVIIVVIMASGTLNYIIRRKKKGKYI